MMAFINVLRTQMKGLTRGIQTSKSMCSYLQDNIPEIIDNHNNDKVVHALQNNVEDLSLVTPYFPNTFNFAAYVNSSETLQNLVKLNVNLSKIEKKPYLVDKLLKFDFENNMKQHIIFLNNYVDMECIGEFITKNPMIFKENLEDLEVRINYLENKHFSVDQIKRIITKNPFWLMFRENETFAVIGKDYLNFLGAYGRGSKMQTLDILRRMRLQLHNTVRIDRRLGFYQQSFDLSGKNVRYLATKQPKLITYNLNHVKCNLFVIKEEIGYNESELKSIILNKPKLLMLNQNTLLRRFNYIHNVMKIPHETILEYPEILLSRNFRVKQRHLFLEKLKRAQYDPKKENYIEIKALFEGTDTDFCKKYAKCHLDEFHIFLKTL